MGLLIIEMGWGGGGRGDSLHILCVIKGGVIKGVCVL